MAQLLNSNMRRVVQRSDFTSGSQLSLRERSECHRGEELRSVRTSGKLAGLRHACCLLVYRERTRLDI
ncbi:hypothetical protein AAFF_G00067870 [Aldrovandia affinis]|uniref:Uncharacterized protein n=1 Tax=Aldrovandia affinis TaxID=143900 RepID=A0AAD7WEK8_9TELE|nr:hypothetical protein AAFF_G00067870 [Aldrovandia affinis]